MHTLRGFIPSLILGMVYDVRLVACLSTVGMLSADAMRWYIL